MSSHASAPFRAPIVDLTSPTRRSIGTGASEGPSQLPCVAHRVYTFHSNCGCAVDDVAPLRSARTDVSRRGRAVTSPLASSRVRDRCPHRSASALSNSSSVVDTFVPAAGDEWALAPRTEVSLALVGISQLLSAGDAVWTGFHSGDLKLLRISDGAPLITHPQAHVGGVTCLARDSSLPVAAVVSGGADGRVLYWGHDGACVVLHQFTSPVRRLEVCAHARVEAGNDASQSVCFVAASSGEELVLYSVDALGTGAAPAPTLLLLERSAFCEISLTPDALVASHGSQLSAWAVRRPDELFHRDPPSVAQLSRTASDVSAGAPIASVWPSPPKVNDDGAAALGTHLSAFEGGAAEGQRGRSALAPFGPTHASLLLEENAALRRSLSALRRENLSLAMGRIEQTAPSGAATADEHTVSSANTSTHSRDPTVSTKQHAVVDAIAVAEPSLEVSQSNPSGGACAERGPQRDDVAPSPCTPPRSFCAPPPLQNASFGELLASTASANLNMSVGTPLLRQTMRSSGAEEGMSPTRSAYNMKLQVGALRRELETMAASLSAVRAEAAAQEEASRRAADEAQFKAAMLQKENDFLREELLETDPVAGERLLLWGMRHGGAGDGTLDAKDRDIANLTAALAGQANDLSEAQKALTSANAAVESLRRDLVTARGDSDHYKRQLEAADAAEGEAMRALVARGQAALDASEQQCGVYRQRIASLEDAIGEMSSEVEARRHRVSDKAVQTLARGTAAESPLARRGNNASFGNADNSAASPERRAAFSPTPNRRASSRPAMVRHDPSDAKHVASCFWCSGKTYMNIGGTFGINESRSKASADYIDGFGSLSPRRALSGHAGSPDV